ncbi:MAG: ABC transporter permease [Eubacteriaceae bacterium]|nr:ABC transporter permease [Eubacteriaceae bacterium]
MNRKSDSKQLKRNLRQMKTKEFFIEVWSNKMARVGILIIAIFALIAIIGPILMPFKTTYIATSRDMIFNSPSLEHLMGTDNQGRDVLAYTVNGSRSSLFVGLTATVISMFLGTVIGIVAGYRGGWVDTLLMRVTDFFLVLPWLPFCMVLAAILGNSIWNIILVIGLTGWSGTARIIRAQTLSVKEQQYVERAQSIGARNGYIMLKHIFPNVFPLVFSEGILTVSSAILTETSLAFLGLGDPTNPSWGTMLNDAYETGAMTMGAWWYFITPGICVILVALGFTLMGYAFDEILNPKLKER